MALDLVLFEVCGIDPPSYIQYMQFLAIFGLEQSEQNILFPERMQHKFLVPLHSIKEFVFLQELRR